MRCIMSKQQNIINKKSWEEFRFTGLLLFINQILHVFGWAIIFQIDEHDDLTEVYPARVKFRGFEGEAVTNAYRKMTDYLSDNIHELKEEAAS